MEARSFNSYCDLLFDSEKVRLSQSSISNMTVTLKYFNQFNPKVQFDELNHELIRDFERFLYEKKIMNNTVNAHLARIKKYVLKAFYEGIIQKNPFAGMRFKMYETYNVYLTDDEIKRIYNIALMPGSVEENVRDSFVIMCYTGLRYSDVNITRANVIDVEVDNKRKIKCLKIVSKKTNTLSIIPIHPIVMEILIEHDFNIVAEPNRRRALYHLKRFALKAKLNSEHLITKRIGGDIKTIKKKKWQMIGLHTGRRSAATNMFMSGISALSIMKITGHTSESSFNKYIKMTSEENAIKLTNHKYFKTKNYENNRRRKTKNSSRAS